MIYSLLILYSLAFAFLAHKNFRLALGLLIISLPTYLVRLKLGPLPSTFLEVEFGIIFLVWLIKFARKDWPYIQGLLLKNRWLLLVPCFLLFASSAVSIFISDMWYYSLGQWRAYFFEPMIFFFILLGRSKSVEKNNTTSTTDLVWFLALSTLSISLFGIAQRFTGWHIGNVDWIALQTHRVTSFFLSPNAVGLYLGPIILLAITVIASEAKQSPSLRVPETRGIASLRFTTLATTLLGALSLITLLLSKSVGAIVALGVGLLLFLFLIGYKKSVALLVLFSLFLAFTPPVQHILTTKDKTTENRLTLWNYSWSYLTESPKNFVFGAGIRQFFRKIQKPYYDVKKMERLIYPHNIFLNFWTETGLVGMVSFTYLLASLFLISYRIYKKSNSVLGAGLLCALVVLFVHGLIDVPYFKNDLALEFWILAALIVNAEFSSASFRQA